MTLQNPVPLTYLLKFMNTHIFLASRIFPFVLDFLITDKIPTFPEVNKTKRLGTKTKCKRERQYKKKIINLEKKTCFLKLNCDHITKSDVSMCNLVQKLCKGTREQNNSTNTIHFNVRSLSILGVKLSYINYSHLYQTVLSANCKGLSC